MKDQTKDHLLRLFRYTRHANGQVIDALEAVGSEDGPPRARSLLAHLLRAQDVWLERAQRGSATTEIWAEDSLAACRRRAEASAARWQQFLEGCAPGDFDAAIRYENSKGNPFSNTLREIASHVVNHSTHHRAQIALLLRKAGGEPPVTDYIFWERASQ